MQFDGGAWDRKQPGASRACPPCRSPSGWILHPQTQQMIPSHSGFENKKPPKAARAWRGSMGRAPMAEQPPSALFGGVHAQLVAGW